MFLTKMINILLLWTTYTLGLCKDAPIVTLPDGKIRGLEVSTSRNHIKFYAYLGIPYAAPPVGSLRFQPPLSPKKWNGILEANSNRKICYQTGRNNKYETEDCLYINVYTPVEPGSNTQLPIMMDTYGGSFRRGSASFGYMKPQYIIERGVIVVTMNYRVGPFGFLSTEDTVIPGNAGLKDQQFALKWVQRNIHLFGGDPRKVTLMGQSAGAASVTYQILSASSAGLFRAAISQSGTALCNWAHQTHATDVAYGIAAEINSSFTRNHSTIELRDFLLSVDAKAIDSTDDKYNVFAPVIEVPHDGAMITESMYESVKNGKINNVPLLIGFNSEESIYLAKTMGTLKNIGRAYDHNVSTLADEDMNITDNNTLIEVGKLIKEIYTLGNFADNLGSTVQYVSDNSFIRGIIRYAELQSSYTDVYFYQFSYHGKLGGNKYHIDGIPRVAHAEDCHYLWTYTDNLRSFPDTDITTVDRYVELFTNFAKTLDPTPIKSHLLQNLTWPRVTESNFYYMDIDTNLSIKKNPRQFSFTRWVELYEAYAKKPHISF